MMFNIEEQTMQWSLGDQRTNERRMKPMSKVCRELWLSPTLLALTLITGPTKAGPCSEEIARAQAELKLRIDVDAGCQLARQESIKARLHHQPTPDSVGQEAQKDKSATTASLLQAMARAREADARGDREECRNALRDFHGLMK
jgi:hypothetical protein